MHIKVLGPMTKQCELLLQNAAIAAKKLKCHAEFERVNDLRRVVAYGVMALPALVIDEKVVAGGSVLPVEEIMEIIRHLNYFLPYIILIWGFFCCCIKVPLGQ